MTADDLATLGSLLEKHRKVLAEELDVTTCRALVMAERGPILAAMRRRRITPRPTLEDIAVWQDEARAQLAAAPSPTGVASATPDWERAASFAVVFDQREGDSGREQRLAVEQTEIEGAAPEHVWPSWDCSELCAWMRGQIEAAAAAAPAPRGARGTQAGIPTAAVRIDGVWLVDSEGERAVPPTTDLAGGPMTATSDTRLAVAVTAPRADQVVSIVLMLCPPGQEPRQMADPIEIEHSGRGEFDVSWLAAGRHEGITVYARVPLGGASFAEFPMPPLERLPTPPPASP